MTDKRLVPVCTVSDNTSEVFSVRFSPDGKLLAAGCGDGAIRVYNALNGNLAYELKQPAGPNIGLPTTSIRFRPLGASKTKNVLIAANADGSLSHWHITSGKCLHQIRNDDNQLYCLDYRSDGAIFATAGKDQTVRVYDEATKTQISELKHGTSKVTPGHSNRVFSLKFYPIDPNVILSGGWDNTIQIWDLRQERAVRSVYGPHICGDSVDAYEDTILSASWRPKKQLQIWDFNSGKLIEDIPWHQSAVHSSRNAMLYTAQFSKNDADFIAAGGSGSNEAKVFDRTAGNKLVGTVSGLSRAVFTVDFDHMDRKLAVAGGDTAIRILQIETRSTSSSHGLTPRPSLDAQGMAEALNPDTEAKEPLEEGVVHYSQMNGDYPGEPSETASQ